MADARITQPSFTGGELAPELYARKDLARYQVGVRKAVNMFIHATGGMSNRPGLKLVGEVPDQASDAKLRVFEAAEDDAFLLVFSDLLVSPVWRGSYVMDGLAPFTIATVYPEAALSDIYIEQSNDVATITHPDYAIYELKRFDTLDWQFVTVDFTPQVPYPTSISATTTAGYTGYGTDKDPVSHVYKIASISTDGEEGLPSGDVVSSADVVLGYEKNYVTLAWTPPGERRVSSDTPAGSTLMADNQTSFNRSLRLDNSDTVVAVDVWSDQPGAMEFKIAQRTSANNMTIVYSEAFAHAGSGWQHLRLAVPYAVPGAGDFYTGGWNGGVNMKLATHNRSIKAGNATGASSGWVEATGSEVIGTRVYYQSTTGYEGTIDEYAIYKERNGVFGILGTTPDTSFKDNNIAIDFTQGPQEGTNPFTDGNFPRIVSFGQGRRWFAGSRDNPQTIWATQSGNFYNMAESSPSRESDSLSFTLASERKQDIFHMLSMGDGFIVFTRSGEWKITGREGDIITPQSILPLPQSKHGSSRYLRPIIAGETLLFADRTQKRVLEMEYSITVDKYKAVDLTLLSSHIFSGDPQTGKPGRTIVSWAHAKNPYGLIWCVLSDGTAASLTYLKDHEVWGWTRHETNGRFLDVAVVPEGTVDTAYFIVERVIGGTTKRFVEYLVEREFADVRDAFFVDCGISYDEPHAITAISFGATTRVTSAAHGLVDGATIELDEIALDDGTTGDAMDAGLVTGRFLVDVFDANNFDLLHYSDNDDLGVVAGDPVDTSTLSSALLDLDRGPVWREAVQELVGLDHLEGRQVIALGDGTVVDLVDALPLVVAGGEINLGDKFARVHIGLPYRSVLGTLDLLNTALDDTGEVKSRSQVQARLKDTRGIKVGISEEEAFELEPRSGDETYFEPPELMNGLYELAFVSNWATDIPVYFVQDYPLPMTVLGLTVDYAYGGT